jgi:hypothetical protein
MTLTDETLLTLKDACEIFFGGKATPATLKAEHARGNLVLTKIGRAWWTTPADIRLMRNKCRVDLPARNSGSTSAADLGRSSMADPGIARGAALRKLDELKQHFGNTSKGSTSRQPATRR